LDTQFEKILLSVLLKDQNFLDKTMGYINENTFSNEYYKYFFTLIERYYNKYHKVLPFEIFKYLFQHTINDQGFSDEEKPLISQMIGDIFTLDYDIEFINKELGNHIKANNLRNFLTDANQNFDVGDIEQYIQTMGQIQKYNPDDSGPMEYTSSLHLRSANQVPIPTLIGDLDTKIGGGIVPGEFGLISAQTGGCKSTMLLNFAWGAVISKKKVLVITLEDSRDTVMQRFDSLFSNQEFVNFRRDPSHSLTIKNKVAKHKGLLYVQDFSSGVCTVGQIRSVMSQMKDLDLVIVDYLDELGSGGTKRSDRWQEVEDSARQLKALAHELNIPVWTATQTSAASYGKEFQGLQHIYGGKGKAHIAHIVLSICQTREEQEDNKLRIVVSKQKSGPKGGIIKCVVDLSKFRIYDAKIP
jgi:replicative DNA helicase